MKVKAFSLELRGISNKVSKNGNVFYNVNVETQDGTPYSLYCPKMEALPQGLKKGDIVDVELEYSVFDRKERLTVSKVEKALA